MTIGPAWLQCVAAYQIETGEMEALPGVNQVRARDVAVRLWDGTTWQPESGSGEPARCTLVLQHPGALRKMFVPPSDLSLGEAYIYNDFDIEGNIEALFPLMEPFLDGHLGMVEQLRYGKRLLSLPKTDQPRPSDMAAKVRGAPHSKVRDKQAVTYHYFTDTVGALLLGTAIVCVAALTSGQARHRT